MHISVRAVTGRIARTSARGDVIPHDRYIPVEKSHYINRLLDHWGDIEVEPVAVALASKTNINTTTATATQKETK